MESHGTSASTDGLVQKSGSRIAVFSALAVLLAGFAILVLTGPSAAPETTANPPVVLPHSSATTTSLAAPTTTADESVNASTTTETSPRSAQPERGLFRDALAGTLTAPCDDLIDGPEPVPQAYYSKHEDCVEQALINLDERCRLAASFFFVMPGEDALDQACDDQSQLNS